MYKIKEEVLEKYNIKKYGKVKDGYLSVRELAKKAGLKDEGHLSRILNGKETNISKITAYAITKAICSDLEIENLFNII